MFNKHLGEFYYDIRFGSMTLQEFCKLEEKYTEVLASDFKTIIQMIAEPTKTSDEFTTARRQAKWSESGAIKCERDNLTDKKRKLYAVDNEEKLIFSTSKPLLLGNFECKAMWTDKIHARPMQSVLSVKVKITETRTLNDPNATVLASMTANLEFMNTTVSLPQPILLRPDVFYTIYVRQLPDEHYIYSKSQWTAATLNQNIRIKVYKPKIVKGKIIGFIETLNFNEV